MTVKHIFLETMFDDFTPDSVSREELISILLDDLMVVARDNLSIEYLENGGDAEEALKLFSVEMRKNLEALDFIDLFGLFSSCFFVSDLL